MRHLSFAALTLCLLLAVPRTTRAGQITYDLQNYPADQNGHTLSGTITTDGTIGTILGQNIVSWNVTIDATDNFSSLTLEHDTVPLGMIATPTELTLPPPLTTGQDSLLLNSTSEGGLYSSILWGRSSGLDSY